MALVRETQRNIDCSTYPFAVVAFQGTRGSYAHLMATMLMPDARMLAFSSFEEAALAVEKGEADVVILPVENSTMGRIADIHALLPTTQLYVVGEAFLPIRHCLMGVVGATLETVRDVYSQRPALLQCKRKLKSMGLTMQDWFDTASAARQVAEWGDVSRAALASCQAAEEFGLHILDDDMSDESHNTTRFLLLAREMVIPPDSARTKVAMMFRVRDVPAALYKALGGFATNAISLTKLESYLVEGQFVAAEFYVELEAHIYGVAFEHALEELKFFADYVRILGCFMKNDVKCA